MIIIAENKKNHYMIKNFLVDFKNYKNINENSNGKFHQAFDGKLPGEDKPVGVFPIVTEDRPATKDEIKFVADKNPKYRSFLNKFLNTSKFVLPLMAAVLLYNSTHFNSPEQETAIEKIKQANPKNIVPEETNSEEDIIIDFNKNLSFEHVLNIVGNNEGFRPTPYPDHHQWSIGYGSRVSDNPDSFINTSYHNQIRSEYDEIYSEYARSSSEQNLQKLIDFSNKYYGRKFDKKTKKHKSTDNKWYQDLHGLDTLPENCEPITKEKATKMLEDKVKDELSRLKKFAKFDINKMPASIQEALTDMAYNMGGGFIKKFKKLHKLLQELDSINNIGEKMPSEATLYVYEDLLEEITREIFDSKYREDLKTRANKNIEKILNALDDLGIVDAPIKTFQSESIKKIYRHLFV
tara:strand:+ start:207 stop:1427 length:1221 start_codon:yes stop_codon:yes gene_type:complete